LSHSTNPFLWWVFLKQGLKNCLPWLASFDSWSFWFLPPKQLGFQVWATDAQLQWSTFWLTKRKKEFILFIGFIAAAVWLSDMCRRYLSSFLSWTSSLSGMGQRLRCHEWQWWLFNPREGTVTRSHRSPTLAFSEKNNQSCK
jgi:hypothetical protein